MVETDRVDPAADSPGPEFRVLGPLEVRVGGQPVVISGHRRRVVLLMLLLEPGRVVTVGRLMRAVWDGSPPKTAETQIQICVSQLRSLLGMVGDVELIQTRAAGYLLQASGDAIDMVRFSRLVSAGRAAAVAGDLPAAAAQLRTALDLWRGEVGADTHSRTVHATAVRLHEERLAVLQEWIGLELDLGHHHERVADLVELVDTYPLREGLHAQLALALYRTGRQAEALAACRRARELLAEQHGIDPGAELRRLESAILRRHASLDPVPPRAPEVVPRQLPAPSSDFVGRQDTVDELGSHLALGDQGRPGVQVVSISGAAGVGKSALAVQLAHQVRQHYPDGQLYVHLRGTDPVPARPEQVLQQFLRALGVPPGGLPHGLAELSALLRSRLSGHRVLVVLDDAASAAQVQPLLPGDPGCAVVITSRPYLPGLPCTRQVSLEVLDADASLTLLARLLGEGRVRAEPEATVALTEACGNLPLALQIAAGKLTVKPHWRVSQLVDRLQDERRRLDELTLDERGVRPSISISYQALAPDASRLLLLLGTLGTVDFGVWVASPLLGRDMVEAADVMEELLERRLVEVHAGVGYQARYRLHELTRIFALERLSIEVSEADRAAAQHRILQALLTLAAEAHRREHGGDFTILHSDVPPWPLPAALVDALLGDPMQWFQREHQSLASGVSLAAQLRQDDLCWDLAVTSVTLFETRADHDTWRETHQVALDSVQRSGNRRGEAVLRYSLGSLALTELRLEDSRQNLIRALTWFIEADDRHGRGLTLRHLASIDRMRGAFDLALARYGAALADLRTAGDQVAVANVLRSMAQIELERGQAGEAGARLRDAIAICAEVGARRVEAQARYRLGEVLLANDDRAGAEAAFRAVLDFAADGSDVVARAKALFGLGRVHIAREEWSQAGAALDRALDAARRSGNPLAEGQTLLAAAELRIRSGVPATAGALLDNAEAIFTQVGAQPWRTRAATLRRELGG